MKSDELETYIDHLKWIFRRRSREQVELFEEIKRLTKELKEKK